MHTSCTHAIKALYEKTVFNKITTKNNLDDINCPFVPTQQ
jgi:hypothetical protein